MYRHLTCYSIIHFSYEPRAASRELAGGRRGAAISKRFYFFLILLMVAPAALHAQGAADSVQIGFPGNFSGAFAYLNSIPPQGLDVNGDGFADIRKPCSCRPLPPIPNGTQSNAGVFDSWLVIATGVSGQSWQLSLADNALTPGTLTPMPPWASINEVGATGIYVLHFAHRDAAQYAFLLTNQAAYPGHTFGPVLNTCYYPDPEIEYLDNFYCSNEPPVLLFGGATSAYDGNLFPLQAQDEFWVITRQQNGQTYFTSQFSPQTLGQGHYNVRYTFDAGDNAYASANKTGCAVTVEAPTLVRTAGNLACNSSINITLNPTTCVAEIIPAQLLSYTPITWEGYRAEVFDPFGNSLGTTVPADYAFTPLLGVLIDDCTGEFCTTDIIVRDIHAPVLTAPADTTVPCTGATSPDATGHATAIDCSPFNITWQDQTANFTCGNPSARITRTWRATDVFGNTTTRVQLINIARGTQAQLRFPPAVEYECSEYAADPSIVAPLPGKAGIPTLVDTPLCGMIYSSRDDTLPFCGNANASFVILRTWLVLDLCGTQIFSVDGAGNSNIQVIRVRDLTPPVINAAPLTMPTNLSALDNGLSGCSATGFIPPPEVSDACNTFQIRIYTPLGEADYVNGTNGAQGGFVPYPGLPLGTHLITYEAVDACGNISVMEEEVEVADQSPPVMLCNNSFSMVLSGIGTGQVFPQQVDQGSRDDCCVESRLLKLIGEPDSAFRPALQFECPPAGPQEIVLRMTDCFGNFNECNAFVQIIDPVSPSVVSAPPNTAVTCLDDLAPFSDPNYLAPVFTDNCPFDVEFSMQSQINSCGIGTVQRTWIAGGSATVHQTVAVNGVFNYSFRLPNDLAEACNLNGMPDTVLVLSQTCDQLLVTMTQQTIAGSPDGNCRSIQRTYDIVNLCEATPDAPLFTLPRLDGADVGKGYDVVVQNGTAYQIALDGSLIPTGAATGRYRYVQRQDVLDEEAPQLAFVPQPPFCSGNDCSGPVLLDFSISDNCADEFTIIRRILINNQTLSPDNFGTLTPTGPGQFRIAGNYPVGTHSIELVIGDGCGNSITELLPFEVLDCQAPVLVCRQDLVITLDSAGMLDIAPATFVLLASDNCPGTQLSFDPFEVEILRPIDCDSIGYRTLNVWLTDAAGNQSACQASIEVQAPGGTCPEFWPIRGTIRTENQTPVGQVTVRLTGNINATEITGVPGQYLFEEVPGSHAYTVRPEKLINTPNGISTFDLVLTSRHILGVDPFNSPYKIIAADVNRSGNVSTLDLILMRRIILGLDTAFANNTSWRFVPANYEFQVPTNPFFGAGFPEHGFIPNLTKDTTINFIGIKVGDVNLSADAQQLDGIEARDAPALWLLETPVQRFRAGERINVLLTAAEPAAGGQWTLQYDEQVLRWENTASLEGTPDMAWGIHPVAPGRLAFSWNETAAGAGFTGLELHFSALRDGAAEDALAIGTAPLRAEAYLRNAAGQWEEASVALRFRPDDAAPPAAWQTGPNPFDRHTWIRFRLAAPSRVTWTLSDAAGRIFRQQEAHFPAGDNTLPLNAAPTDPCGLWVCRVQSEEGTMELKLVRMVQ